MSSPDPAPPHEVEFNPYAAPEAEIGARVEAAGPVDSADEALRRAHLPHEARVRSIGILGFAASAFWGLYGGFMLVAGIVLFILTLLDPNEPQYRILGTLAAVGLSVLFLAIAFGFFALGRGLRRLKNWARWTWIVLFSLPPLFVSIVAAVFALNLIQGYLTLEESALGKNPLPLVLISAFYYLLPGWLLYLLLCRESQFLFTPEYREVVARTPHIRYKTSRGTKITVAVLLAALFALALAIAVLHR